MANGKHYQTSLTGSQRFRINVDDVAKFGVTFSTSECAAFNTAFGSTTAIGKAKLYDETGYNIDGAMTQRATTVSLDQKANISELSVVAFSGLVDDLLQAETLVINCGSSMEVI